MSGSIRRATVPVSYTHLWEYEMEYNGIPEGVPLVADEVVEQLKDCLLYTSRCV